jgi:shikimate kinase
MTTDLRESALRGLTARLNGRSIVLVGLMGAGKSTVGKRLATRLGLPFVDADSAIEEAAGMTIPEIFALHGEPYFRAGEVRVIQRLLTQSPQVLATGGGAYMNETTRENIARSGVSLWLDVLLRRVKKRVDRPLLKADNPEAVMKRLIQERYPVYALADITVESRDVPHEVMVDAVIEALNTYFDKEQTP